jgi:hypothetical protein
MYITPIVMAMGPEHRLACQPGQLDQPVGQQQRATWKLLMLVRPTTSTVMAATVLTHRASTGPRQAVDP